MLSLTLLAMTTPTLIAIVVIVGFLLFGRRLPEMGRSLGKAIVEFKKGLSGIEDEIQQAGQPPASPPAPPPAIEPPRQGPTQSAYVYSPAASEPKPAVASPVPRSPEFKDGPHVG